MGCRISSEAADFDFAGTHGLNTNIDSREPASINRMRVIPSDNVFGSVDSLAILRVTYHVFISVCRSIY